MYQPRYAHPLSYLYLGDSIEVMKSWPENSIDAVVCDPPYLLGFMAKAWDRAESLQHEAWAREALRVLKPGGHVVAFGGSRTYHRLACAIEDAGFEIRDSLMWLYGCLDDASEALTKRGWVRGVDLRDDDEVCQWREDGSLSWVRPRRIIVKPYKGKLVVLKNRHVEMHLTPDHRVPLWLKRHSRAPRPMFEVVDAGELKPHWLKTFPVAGRLNGPVELDPKLAYLVGWWLTDAWAHGDGKAVMFSQSKPRTLAKLREALAPYSPSEYVKRGKLPQHADEHTFYVTGGIAEFLLSRFPSRALGWEVLSWSREARLALFDGLMDGDGSRPVKQDAQAFWSKKQERRDVFAALCVSLGFRAYDDPENWCVHVNTSADTTQMQAKHGIGSRDYDGLVWCVTVDSGYFVARRNGCPFITGNSGFPKSLNIGEGRGTALKPAHEPIVLARKPLDGTVAANVAKWGTGALNIDGCRIATTGEAFRAPQSDPAKRSGVVGSDLGISAADTDKFQAAQRASIERTATLGRWPANVVLDEEAGALLDAQSGTLKSGGYPPEGGQRTQGVATGKPNARGPQVFGSSQGGASRFFYCPKVSRAERDAGCAHLPDRTAAETVERDPESAGAKNPRAGAGRGAGAATRVCVKCEKNVDGGRATQPCEAGGEHEIVDGEKRPAAKNHHPTVKPVALMAWLVRLVTPPGGLVLDPFTGSGSTGVACVREGRRFVGIDREPEYVEIAAARIGHALNGGQ